MEERRGNRSSSSALFEVLEQTCGTIVVLDFFLYLHKREGEKKKKRGEEEKKSRVSAIQRADCLQRHTNFPTSGELEGRGEPPRTGTFISEAERKLCVRC